MDPMHRTRMAGFTLVELMMVIVVAAILLGVGIPSYKNITTSYRISGEINGLLGDIQFARAEAIKEGQSVTICALPANAGSTPSTCAAAGASTGWQNGWIVFPDPTGAQTGTGTNGWASVLRYQPPFSGNAPDTLVDRSSGTIAVTYNREGLIGGVGLSSGLNANNNDTFLSLRNSAANPQYTRCLQITAVGATQVVQPAANAVSSSNANCT